MKNKNIFISLLALTTFAFLLAACSSAEPQVATEQVEVTRIVEKNTEVEVPVEVTRVVEQTTEVEVTRVVEVDMQPEEKEPVTLEFYHWFGADLGATTIDAINAIFHAENPYITVEFETADTGTYEQVLNTRLSAGDAPDVFGVFPGTKFHPQAEAGFLMDLSGEPWVDNLLEGAKFVSTYDGKVMTLPIDANVIGVIYNKQIFADLGLEPPTTWDGFLQTCDTIKEAGITPISLGLQSAWVTQLIPYAMAPSAIYRDNLNFDAQMYAGEVTFVGSPWEQMMADYLDLEARGCFNDSALGTDYNLSTDLMANGEAAMLVQGNWAVAALRDKAPDLEWGMFPLPYDNGGDIWVSAATGGTIAGSATTEHPEEVRKYIAFWARPDIAELYLTEKGAFPVSSGVNPEIDPAAAEMLPYVEVGSYPFLDQNWPPGVQGVMLEGIQAVFAGEMTVEEMLQEMDVAWAEGTAE